MSLNLGSNTRPEHFLPPELFYNDSQAKKYATNTRVLEIQTEMTKRAIELLALPENSPPLYLLDIGCGSGISGQTISSYGHVWIGMDISQSMLDLANDMIQEEEYLGSDLILSDIGNGLPFRLGSFDGCISISAIQWLCNADRKALNPIKRLQTFFGTLYKSLRKGARAVLQFYPENSEQIELITNMALKSGFGGGLVVDYPHSTKARKYYLVLFAGMPNVKAPEGKQEETIQMSSNGVNAAIRTEGSRVTTREQTKGKGKKRKNLKEFIIKKKEKSRQQGKETRAPSKYTARSRGPKF
ncbi:hypothetical protein ABK040_001251 [Willaertia magna]